MTCSKTTSQKGNIFSVASRLFCRDSAALGTLSTNKHIKRRGRKNVNSFCNTAILIPMAGWWRLEGWLPVFYENCQESCGGWTDPGPRHVNSRHVLLFSQQLGSQTLYNKPAYWIKYLKRAPVKDTVPCAWEAELFVWQHSPNGIVRKQKPERNSKLAQPLFPAMPTDVVHLLC
jgi:hypothetical protein